VREYGIALGDFTMKINGGPLGFETNVMERLSILVGDIADKREGDVHPVATLGHSADMVVRHKSKLWISTPPPPFSHSAYFIAHRVPKTRITLHPQPSK